MQYELTDHISQSDIITIKRNIKKEKYPKYNVSNSTSTHNLPAINATLDSSFVKDSEDVLTSTRSPDFHNKVNQEALESNDLILTAYNILEQLFGSNLLVYSAIDTMASNLANVHPSYYVNLVEESDQNKYFKHNIKEILNYPNSYETGYELRKKTFLSLAHFGNAYWQVRSNKAGTLYSLNYIPAKSMRVVPFLNEATDSLDFAYIQLDSTLQNIQKTFFDDEIIHFKMPNHLDYCYGFPPAIIALKELTFDEESKKFLSSFFNEAFSAGMIFSMPNATKDIVARNRSKIKNHFSGGRNFGKAMIMEGDTRIAWDGNKLKDGFPLIQLKDSLAAQFLPSMGVPLSIVGMHTQSIKMTAEAFASDEQSHLRKCLDYTNCYESTINLKILRNPNILDEKFCGIAEVQLGLNNTFSRKHAVDIVKGIGEYGVKLNDAQQMFGLPKFENSEIGETIVTKTNNGIVPLDSLIKLMPEKLQLQNDYQEITNKQLKDQAKEENKENDKKQTDSEPKISKESDKAKAQPSLSVSFEEASTTLD